MVSATSLENLIPMPSKWGVATKAIRVPLELAEEFLTMANTWAEKLREAFPNAEIIETEYDPDLVEMERQALDLGVHPSETPKGRECYPEVVARINRELGVEEQPKSKEDNFNEWIAKQDGYTVESFELVEEEFVAIETPVAEKISSPAINKKVSKQEAKLARRKANAQKAGKFKGFAPKRELTEEEKALNRYYRIGKVYQELYKECDGEIRDFLRDIRKQGLEGKYNQYCNWLEEWDYYLRTAYPASPYEMPEQFQLRKEMFELCMGDVCYKFGGGLTNGNNDRFRSLVHILISQWDVASVEIDIADGVFD